MYSTMAENATATAVGNLLHVKLNGKPSEEAFCFLTARVAEHVGQYGKISLLIEVAEDAPQLADPFSRAFWEGDALLEIGDDSTELTAGSSRREQGDDSTEPWYLRLA